MAIAFDTATDGGGVAGGSNTNITWSHTCNGSNRLLVVAVEVAGNSGSNLVSGVTYNSVALTKRSEQSSSSNGTNLSFWYLINPATGSNTVSVTTFSAEVVLVGSSASYNGVKQTGFPDNFGDSTVTIPTTSVSNAITSAVDNCWHIGVGITSGVPSAGASTTKRVGNSIGNNVIIDNNGAITPAGSNTIILTSSVGNGDQQICGITIAPFTSNATNSPIMMMGV